MTTENNFKTKIIKIKLGTPKQIAEPSFENDESNILDEVASLLINGVEVLVFNTYLLTPRKALTLGKKIKQLCAEFNAILLLKGKADVAFAIKPDAFILDKDNIDIHLAKEILGEDCLIGYLGNFDKNNPIKPDFIINGHAISEKTLVFRIFETKQYSKTLILQES